MQDIQIVKFYEDELSCIRDPDGRRVWVVVRRVCEALGLDESTQRRKVQNAAWAVAGIMPATAHDGKRYESFCIELNSLPMWLATINPAKVGADIRPKLERYQREARDVLAAHFLGRDECRTLARVVDPEARSLDPTMLAIVERTASAIALPIIANMKAFSSRIDDVCAEVNIQGARVEQQSKQIADLRNAFRAEQVFNKDSINRLEAAFARRKRVPNDTTARLHRDFAREVLKECPCCFRRPLFDGAGECVGELDHFVDNAYPKPDGVWLTCAECNRGRLRDPAKKRDAAKLFDTYQHRFAAWRVSSNGPLFAAL